MGEHRVRLRKHNKYLRGDIVATQGPAGDVWEDIEGDVGGKLGGTSALKFQTFHQDLSTTVIGG